MKKIVLALLLIPFSLYSEEPRDYRQMDWNKGTISDLSLGLLSIEEYQNHIPASLKLKTKGPRWYREDWLPLRCSSVFARGDLDRDGDTDMLLSEMWSPVSFSTLTAYEYTGTKADPSWRRRDEWNFYLSENPNTKGYGSPRLIDFDKDGDLDLWLGLGMFPNGKTTDAEIYAFENIGTNSPIFKRNREWEPPGTPTTYGIDYTCPNLVDNDKDGDYDIFMTGGRYTDARGHTIICCTYKNDGTPSAPKWVIPTNDNNWYPPAVATGHDGHTSNNVNLTFFDFKLEGSVGDVDILAGRNDEMYIILYKKYWPFFPGSVMWTQYTGGHMELATDPIPIPGRFFGDAPWFCLEDADGDGDDDLLWNDNGTFNYFYEYKGSTWTESSWSNGKPYPRWDMWFKTKEDTPFIGILCTPFPVDIDGDGDYDICLGNGGMSDCEGGYMMMFENIGSRESVGGAWKQRMDWRLMDKSLYRCIPRFLDMDGDGDYDYIFGAYTDLAQNLKTVVRVFENKGNPSFPIFDKDVYYDLPTCDINAVWQIPCFIDMDRDGDLDMYYVYDWYSGYPNGRMIRMDYYENDNNQWIRKKENDSPIPVETCWFELGASISLEDIDQDGDIDMVISRGIGKKSEITFYENIGGSDPSLIKNLVKNEEWAKIPWEGVYADPMTCLADMDNDGDLDLYIGNSPGNAFYFENIGDHYQIGTYTSTIFSKNDWKKIFWNETILDNTSINLEIREKNGLWKKVNNGEDISSLKNKDIQYRAILSTSDPKRSPVLYEVALKYEDSLISISPYSGPVGQIITVQGTGFGSNRIVRIDFGTNKTIAITKSNNGTFSLTFITSTQKAGSTMITVSTIGETFTCLFRIISKITVFPTIGPIGALTTVQGTGFGNEQPIRIDFGTNKTITTTTSTTNGTFKASFIINTQSQSSCLITAFGQSYIETAIYKISYGSVTIFSPSGNITDVYPGIQDGVDNCLSGGTVSVSAGTYTETVYINKGIALIGIGTPTITAYGLGETSVVTFYGVSTNNASISGFRITGATGYGSNGNGIYCNQGSPTINHNILTGNSSDGIHCNQANPTITNNILTGNGSYGIHCHNFSSPTITNNILTGNSSDGIYCYYSSSPSITNNILTGNNYRGIYCYYSSSPSIINNTLTGNGSYGIHCNSSSPTIYNNIITKNGTISTYYGIYNNSGTPTINYNCVFGNGLGGNRNYYNCSAGPNDISVDPQFIGNDDFHLQSTSSCINAGSNTVPALPLTDKDGNPRIMDGTVDMGAYEYQGNAFPDIILHKSSDKGFVAKGGTITYTIRYENIGEAEARDVMIIEVLPNNCKLQIANCKFYYVNGKWQETPSSSATKIKWLIPQIAPGASGTASFTVEVR
ncbi:MAG: right-handed parallel beta-helix repeat-containing protein [bacterium]